MAFRLLVFYIVSLLVVINHFVEYSYSLDFNFTVSLDGLGNFTRVSDAIAKAPNFSTTRFYIHVKPGTYHEHVEVPAQKTFIALIGDDPSTTLIVDNRSNHTGFSTPTSATLSKLSYPKLFPQQSKLHSMNGGLLKKNLVVFTLLNKIYFFLLC